MKKLILLFIGLILSGCALAEPSMFIITNNSSYPINVTVDVLDRTFTVKKNKSELVVAQPSEINLTITIEEIGLTKHETFKLNYLEKKMININVNE